MVNVLTLLTMIAHNVPQIRPFLLHKLFPHRDFGAEEVEEEKRKREGDKKMKMEPPGRKVKCMGNVILNHMTAINDGLKYFTNELLFQLCDEDGIQNHLFLSLSHTLSIAICEINWFWKCSRIIGHERIIWNGTIFTLRRAKPTRNKAFVAYFLTDCMKIG